MKRVFVVLLTLAFALPIHAQDKNIADTLHDDTLHIAEQQLLQEQQQNKVDELIKNQLQKQLELLAADSKQRENLEKQLRQIAIRDSLFKKEQRAKIEQLKRTAKGYPVVLLNDTLFYIYTRLGSFNSMERAAAVSARLTKLYEDEFYNADTLKLVPSDNGFDIIYNNDLVVMSISVIDALYFDKTPDELGKAYLDKIKTIISENKAANSVINWARRLAFVAIALIGVLTIIFLIKRVFRLVSRHLISKKENYFKGVTIKKYRLFTPKQHVLFILRVLYVFRLFIILLALYLSLPLLFSIFPQTKTYTYTLLNWVITPAKAVLQNVINYLPSLFTILVIYLFVRYTVKAIKYFALEIETGNLKISGFYRDWAKPTYNIIKFLLYAFMMIVIFPYLPGSSSPAFQGVSVFLGILFSLGSSSAISNLVAGLVITYMRPFKIGDRVKISEITGDVLEKTMLVTRIRTIKNEEITVPNATVLSSHTVNYTKGAEHAGIIIHSTITLGYDVPWKKVHETLINAALATELIMQNPEPFVLQISLEDFYVSYQINAYTKDPQNQAKIYSDLHQNIQDYCNAAGIEILSPHYQAMRDGNTTAIPEEYLPEDYVSPGFKIDQPIKNEL